MKNVKARELFRWGIDSERFGKLADSKKESAIIVIQSLIRRFLARAQWGTHWEAKQRQVCSASTEHAVKKPWTRNSICGRTFCVVSWLCLGCVLVVSWLCRWGPSHCRSTGGGCRQGGLWNPCGGMRQWWWCSVVGGES